MNSEITDKDMRVAANTEAEISSGGAATGSKEADEKSGTGLAIPSSLPADAIGRSKWATEDQSDKDCACSWAGEHRGWERRFRLVITDPDTRKVTKLRFYGDCMEKALKLGWEAYTADRPPGVIATLWSRVSNTKQDESSPSSSVTAAGYKAERMIDAQPSEEYVLLRHATHLEYPSYTSDQYKINFGKVQDAKGLKKLQWNCENWGQTHDSPELSGS